MFGREQRFLSPKKQVDDDRNFQKRPLTFGEFIGYKNQIEKLRYAIEGAKLTGRLKHILLTGFPGTGKSTLADIIANESGKKLVKTTGPDLRTADNLMKVLMQITEGDILFVDEIHSTDRIVQEMLYDVMDNFHFKNGDVEFDMLPFTIIGATTKGGNLTTPLRTRFHTFIALQDYGEEYIKKIMIQAAKKRGYELLDEAADMLIICARRNPRVAIRLVDNLVDVAIVHRTSTIDVPIVKKTLSIHEIDENGFDLEIRNYLEHMANEYPRTVGLKTIAIALSADKDYTSTVEYVIEPWLIHLSLIRKSGNRGRILSDKAIHNEKYGLDKIIMKNYGFIPPPSDGGEGRYRRGGVPIKDDELDDVELTMDTLQNRRRR